MTGTTSGKVTVTASYGGDTYNAGSTKTTKLTVKKARTTLALSCTSTGTNTWSCTATLTGYVGPVGGESIIFSQSGKGKVSFVGTCTLSSGGICQVTVTGTKTGNVTIKAVYPGDTNNVDSSRTVALKVT
jgi:hypothetical protein